MKLLLFSDLHTDTSAARRLVERAPAFDVLIGAGDFASTRRGIERCIDILKAIQQPVVLVAGNNETTEELVAACRQWPQAHVLHGSGVTVNGVEFFGLGGGVPVTPFGDWSYDFTEQQAAELLQQCPPRGVLISHSPPQGAVDNSSRRSNLGSTAVRTVVEQKQPLLVVCGHIHACAGQTAYIGPTPVVNAGPDGVEWELPDITP
jgi:Icc-related predicted phosphoesterase